MTGARDRFRFRAKLTPAEAFDPADTGFVVEFPDWPAGVTQGEDEADALDAAADALRVLVACAIKEGSDIPEPAAELGPGEHWVEINVQEIAKQQPTDKPKRELSMGPPVEVIIYPFQLTPDENGTTIAQGVDIPGALTFGVGPADTMAQAEDALLTAVDWLMREGKPVPRPSEVGPGEMAVALREDAAAELLEYWAVQHQPAERAKG